MVEVEKVLVRDDILKIKFTCDVDKCKGACCTLESPYGAPIEDREVEDIQRNLSNVFEYLPKRHREEIEDFGFWEEKEGELLLKSVDNKSCVFVYFENGIAKCGIEKAYFDGKSDFRKPISCHLFPIRRYDFGGDTLRYEKFSECAPALELGNETNLTIAEFCKDSLTRLYGESWLEKLWRFIKK